MNLKMTCSILTLALAAAIQPLQAKPWFSETLYKDFAQSFSVDKVLFEKKTEFQDLTIFENEMFGKVLTLDGIIQLTEKDEYVYHEMLTHVPIFSHGNVKKVLVIGGGDGGMLREIVKHDTVEKVVLVEIDQSVIELSKKYLPKLSNGAFEDERVEVVIADGCQYVKNTQEMFDLIICDSTDPIGPATVLFTKEFYADCQKALNDNGIFVTQGGVPFMQSDELISSVQLRRELFKDAGCYLGVVPTYVGGFMAFGWSTDSLEHRNVSLEKLTKRFESFSGKLKYYTPEIHKASFALPQFIQDFMIN